MWHLFLTGCLFATTYTDGGNCSMDSTRTTYRFIVEKVLREYAEFLGNDEMVQIEHIFDRERDRYLLVETGWDDGDRVYGTLLHIDIIDNKLWIQKDQTDESVANELVDAGVKEDYIVLGFKQCSAKMSKYSKQFSKREMAIS